MLLTHFTSKTVKVGSAEYDAARTRAERRAYELRIAGKGGLVHWADDYNDYSATGRFVVTGR